MSKLFVTPLGTVSPYCNGDTNCPGFLVTDGNTQILLDCGNGISRLLNMKEDLKHLNIILSHLHKDHYSDLFSLAYASYVLNQKGLLTKKVPVYLPKIETPEEKYLEYSLDASQEDYKLIKNTRENFMSFKDYDEHSKIKIGNIIITFMRTHHPVKTFAIKLEMADIKVIYSSDTGYKGALELINFVKEADLFICESSLIRQNNVYSEFHLHAHQAADIARLARVRKLLLTHFWPEIDKKLYLREAKDVFDDVDVAIEGKTLVIERNCI